MQQPMYSVVQVTDQLNIGGAEQVIVVLANLLQAHGHHSAVITTVAPGALAAKLHPGVQHINLQRRFKWNPVTMYQLVKVLRSFDVVHVHSAYNLRYVYLASRLFFLRKPLFYHEHYGDININITVAWHQRFIYPKTIFIAVSKQLAAWAINTIRLSPERVFLLQNTVLKNKVISAALPSPPYRLLMVVNIRRTKNIEFAIELLKALNRRETMYYLTIAGQINDEVYYREIQQLITDYSLTAQVQFLHHCNDVQSILHQYHLALHTSKSETGPLVLIECLAQGLPFITYRTGEVVQQLETLLPNFIMNDFDIEEWRQAVANIIAMPRTTIATQFDHLYQLYFSPETYYQQCIAIYKEGLQGNN